MHKEIKKVHLYAHLVQAISGSDACVNPRILCWVSWRKWGVLVRASSPSAQMFHFSYEAGKKKELNVQSFEYTVPFFSVIKTQGMKLLYLLRLPLDK